MRGQLAFHPPGTLRGIHSPLPREGARSTRLVWGLGLLLTALFATGAAASTIHVPANQPTIQAGINAAAAFGDEVVIADGTYSGAGNRDIVLNKHVVVRSASGNPALCVIDCQNLGRGFAVSGVVSAARIEGLTIQNALADEGGGIRCDNASPTVTNVRLIANRANVTGGGGLALVNGSAPKLARCLFAGNITNGFEGGAAIYNAGGQPAFVNCVFSGNTTSGVGVIGGVLRNKGGGTVTFTNCTLSANSAYDATVSYSDGTNTVTTLVNCVVWGHAPGTSGTRIQTHANAVTSITYSDVQQGYAGTGNITALPGFIDANGPDNVLGTADDDVRLGRFSPATDAGQNSAPGLTGITVDLAGSPRKVDDANIPDTGSGSAPLVDMGAHERQTASVSVAFQVPGDASTIQAGIDLAQLRDEVVIADGTWSGAGNVNLILDKDITVRSASGNPAACVLDGGAANRLLTFTGTTEGAVLQGLGLQNGRAGEGGGLRFTGAGGTVLNCRLAGNVANGGGGGGAYIESASNPEFWNCVFDGNGTSGVGVTGGALYVKGASTPAFRNCLFTNNTGYDATVLYNDGSGTATSFVNSIVWGNAGGTSGQRLQNQASSSLSVTYCDVEGGFTGTGNLNTNPIFADAQYRLAPISPCVDAGSNAGVPPGLAKDRDGRQRIWDGNGDTIPLVDLGPFEFGAPQVTGVGDRPLPVGFRLLAVSPNPVTSQSRIAFSVPRDGRTSLVLYDVSGRLVRVLVDAVLAEGDQETTWDGRDEAGRRVTAGVYFVRLAWEGWSDSGKVLVVR